MTQGSPFRAILGWMMQSRLGLGMPFGQNEFAEGVGVRVFPRTDTLKRGHRTLVPASMWPQSENC